MIPIYRMAVIQIDITNACHLKCANCTRFVGHHEKPFFMDLDIVIKAIKSLEGYSGIIGMMGGEPTMHPQFEEICKIYQELIPDRRRRALWTAGYKWDEYQEIIEETFDSDLIVYNDHSDPDEGVHQPLLIAAEDILDDKELMWRLIGNCWIQWRWSASITPKGGFFCEVAAASDMLFDGPGGYPLEEGWWNKNPWEFSDQVERYCPKCSAAIPMERPTSSSGCDLVSKSNYDRLKKTNSFKLSHNKVIIYEEKMTKEDIQKIVEKGWTPWNHRSYKQSDPDTKWK